MKKFVKCVEVLLNIAFSVFMLALGAIVFLGIILEYGWFSFIMIPVLLIITGIAFMVLTLMMVYCAYVCKNKKFTGFIEQMTVNYKEE